MAIQSTSPMSHGEDESVMKVCVRHISTGKSSVSLRRQYVASPSSTSSTEFSIAVSPRVSLIGLFCLFSSGGDREVLVIFCFANRE